MCLSIEDGGKETGLDAVLRVWSIGSLGCNTTESAIGRHDLMRDWRIGRLGCNVTERAIEKHDLMRGWSTGRLGCNVTERAIERATGSSECREYRCFSNIQF